MKVRFDEMDEGAVDSLLPFGDDEDGSDWLGREIEAGRDWLAVLGW